MLSAFREMSDRHQYDDGFGLAVEMTAAILLTACGMKEIPSSSQRDSFGCIDRTNVLDKVSNEMYNFGTSLSMYDEDEETGEPVVFNEFCNEMEHLMDHFLMIPWDDPEDEGGAG